MKQPLLAALFAAATLSFAACNNDGANKSKEDSASLSDHDGDHIYSCPMHPDVTGKEGDKCPKCGMALEHTDKAETSNAEYFMQFTTGGSAAAGQPVSLRFVPKMKGKENDPVALDVQHEKKIHLIAVSEDLSWFDHIHPEYGADGSYTVTETFPAGGKYYLFADYKPTGGGAKVDKIEVTVSGAPAPAKSFTADKLSGTSGGYSFALAPTGGKFITGVPMHVTGTLMKDGKAVDASTLENYLAAKAHVVALDVADKNYMHVHPEVAGGKFDLHTTFEKPGMYRWWVQFKADGKVQTIDLTTTVTQGTDADRNAAGAGHDEDGHSHEEGSAPHNH
jgi:hypothetical protein